MRIIEILLPKSSMNKGISLHVARQIDTIQKRMDGYVDKIMDPKTSSKGREFLKAKLKDDYSEFRDLLKPFHRIDTIAEDEAPIKYEVYDKKTGEVVAGPYSTRERARRVVDKKDNEYGAYRYGCRPIKTLPINEAIHTLPLTNDDFDLVKKMMERPIPAAVAEIYLRDIIDDDEFNDQLEILSNTEPNRDIRPFVVEWLDRVMPDQMHRFGREVGDEKLKKGIFSPIHGYDPHIHKGSTDTGTQSSGNAYGSF